MSTGFKEVYSRYNDGINWELFMEGKEGQPLKLSKFCPDGCPFINIETDGYMIREDNGLFKMSIRCVNEPLCAVLSITKYPTS